MKSDELDEKMRAGEIFHNLRALNGTFIVVRVDGRSFSRLTGRICEKPFDHGFHHKMTEAAKAVLTTLDGVYAHTQSDEISVLLAQNASHFDRGVEKLVSIAASAATASLSLALGEPVEFDARLWLGARKGDVVDYFRWRQSDATRSAINNWVYWLLRKEGKSVKDATQTMVGLSTAAKNEMLFKRGINFNEVPAWQRRGAGIYWETITKIGKNPKTGQEVPTQRRRLKVDSDLPMKEAYGKFVRQFLKEEAESG
ncbi:MAG: tRNA 5'-guanylyltransferase [Polyangiaceae bacterium]|nr:tRNA 5'-guanylyltransferase [Polyangiaceae bacterium]